MTIDTMTRICKFVHLMTGALLGALAVVTAIVFWPEKPKPEAEAEAYVLVRGDVAVPLWDYKMLPMKECRWCRRTVNLNRHHVIPQAANPALRDVRENLIVLCRDCHFVLGHRCDWKQYNPDVLYICTHFTNVVRSTDTRYALTNTVERAPAPIIDATPILHVTNDVPDRQKAALERILNGKHD